MNSVQGCWADGILQEVLWSAQVNVSKGGDLR